MTLKDLAREAGVSVATVSKALKNSAEISAATKQRIIDLAKKHGCLHKYYKEKYEKKIVALICPELKSAHYSEQVEYIQARLARHNIDVIISTYDFNKERQSQLIEFHVAHTKIDGMIVFGLNEAIPKGVEVPVVALDGELTLTHPDIIRLNSQHGMNCAVAHLKELGHKNIAFIGEALTLGAEKQFKHAMQQYELPETHIAVTNKRFEEAGKAGVEQLLKNNVPFTALICAYDYIAIGAIKALIQHEIQVPEDVSVIGINNIPTAGHLDKALTTIDQATNARCDLACNLLIKKIQNRFYCSGTEITVTGSLIVRETTAPCKNK